MARNGRIYANLCLTLPMPMHIIHIQNIFMCINWLRIIPEHVASCDSGDSGAHRELLRNSVALAGHRCLRCLRWARRKTSRSKMRADVINLVCETLLVGFCVIIWSHILERGMNVLQCAIRQHAISAAASSNPSRSEVMLHWAPTFCIGAASSTVPNHIKIYTENRLLVYSI